MGETIRRLEEMRERLGDDYNQLPISVPGLRESQNRICREIDTLTKAIGALQAAAS